MKNTVVTIQEAKKRGEKITMLTAYDYSMAKLIDEGIDQGDMGVIWKYGLILLVSI